MDGKLARFCAAQVEPTHITYTKKTIPENKWRFFFFLLFLSILHIFISEQTNNKATTTTQVIHTYSGCNAITRYFLLLIDFITRFNGIRTKSHSLYISMKWKCWIESVLFSLLLLLLRDENYFIFLDCMESKYINIIYTPRCAS